ncbi:hypothetical protein [Phaeobacter sp. HF9A]|nr:hypothetical protein [Phaeobacter sp. HF9A]
MKSLLGLAALLLLLPATGVVSSNADTAAAFEAPPQVSVGLL